MHCPATPPRSRLALVVVLMAGTPLAPAAQSAGTPPAPAAEWTRIEGGPGTGCAQDSTFAFFVRAGDPKKLVVFLAGGGACWNGENCDREGRATYYPRLDQEELLRNTDGILSTTNPLNPVRDFSLVLIPYCTGDLHLGAREVTYERAPGGGDAPSRYVIRHHGARNVASVLEWVARHYPAPDLVVAAGGSAGAPPSAVYAAELAHRFPAARVVQLGDGAGGFRAAAVPGLLAHWGATQHLARRWTTERLDTTQVDLESLYILTARAAPRVTLAQFNYAEDPVQLTFLRMLGVQGVPFSAILGDNLAELRQAIPGFRSFTAPGDGHTILENARFYTLTVDGVAFRDWVAARVEGRPVRNVGGSQPPGPGR